MRRSGSSTKRRLLAAVLACGLAVLVGVGAVAGVSPVPAHAITEGISEKLQGGTEEVDRMLEEEQEQREAKQAQEQREARERAAREAAREASERQADAQAARERSEEETYAREQRAHCVVPQLEGERLAAARTALVKAHCRVGRVRAPSGRHGPLVVIAEGPRPGRRLAHGSAVNVTLGREGRPRVGGR